MSYFSPNTKSFVSIITWWRHPMETFSALLAICARNSPVTGEFFAQKRVTRSFDISFDLRLDKRLSKQWSGWWIETPSRPLWRHCNALEQLQTGTAGRSLMTMCWPARTCTVVIAAPRAIWCYTRPCYNDTWDPFQYPIRRLIVRNRSLETARLLV